MYRQNFGKRLAVHYSIQCQREIKTGTFARSAAAVDTAAVASNSSDRIVAVASEVLVADTARPVGSRQASHIAVHSKDRCTASAASRFAMIASVAGQDATEPANYSAADSANKLAAPIQVLAVDVVAWHTPSVEPALQLPFASAALDARSLIERIGCSYFLSMQPCRVLVGLWRSQGRAEDRVGGSSFGLD